jgi:hypothetical protein
MRAVRQGGWGVGLLLLALVASPAGAEGSQSRPRVSANGIYTVKFAEQGKGHCLLTVTRENGPGWRLGKCLGSAEDLFFVSNDGQQIWVLRTVPRVPRGHRFHQRPERWGKVVVAVRYDRTGKVLEARTLGSFVKRHEREKLVDLGLRFGWLAGVSGAPGAAPRMKDGGVVELDTVADKRYRLHF